MDRRSFLKSAATIALGAALPVPTFFRSALNQAQAATLSGLSLLGLRDSPILALKANELNTTDFTGDNIERTHEVLWDVDGYIQKKGGIPAPSRQVEVAVVGGGISGLSAAYLLRDRKPLLLEQDKRFGGNAKGEQYGNSTFTLGALYLTKPDIGSPEHKLLQELGLLSIARVENAADTTVYYKGKFWQGFWGALTDPAAKAQFQRIYQRLVELQDFSEKASPRQRADMDALSFAEWLIHEFGSVHSHLLEYFQLYAWSSLLGSIDEISAFRMVDFIAAETGEILGFPGGLAAVSARLHQKLYSELGADQVQSRALVIDIRHVGGKVQICYDDGNRNLQTVLAKTCIFAAPKFVAARVVRDMPESQKQAISRLAYRSYIVANVILDRPIHSPCLDLYSLEGQMPADPSAMHPSSRAFTDLSFATWANQDRTDRGVITVFTGLPYDGARQFLFNPDSHEKYKQRILAGLQPLLGSLGLGAANVSGIRLTRWGHAMPVATKGLIKSRILEQCSAPVGQVVFANQDNESTPSFESAFGAAVGAVERVQPKME